MLRHPNGQGQITLPKEYLKTLGVTPQDYFDVQLQETSIVLTPVTVHPLLSEGNAVKLEELFNSPANRGRRFANGRTALKHLKRRIKRS